MKQLILFVFVVFAGCRQELPSIPKEVIPMKEMVQLMADIHITDAVAADKAQGGLDERVLTDQYMQQVFKNRGVTSEKFMSSYRFYETHPVLYDKMYEEVLEEMSKRESKLFQP